MQNMSVTNHAPVTPLIESGQIRAALDPLAAALLRKAMGSREDTVVENPLDFVNAHSIEKLRAFAAANKLQPDTSGQTFEIYFQKDQADVQREVFFVRSIVPRIFNAYTAVQLVAPETSSARVIGHGYDVFNGVSSKLGKRMVEMIALAYPDLRDDDYDYLSEILTGNTTRHADLSLAVPYTREILGAQLESEEQMERILGVYPRTDSTLHDQLFEDPDNPENRILLSTCLKDTTVVAWRTFTGTHTQTVISNFNNPKKKITTISYGVSDITAYPQNSFQVLTARPLG